jgi:hypothetical protein
MDTERTHERARTHAIGATVGIGVVLAVLSPFFVSGPDSFPISSFPMFAHVRASPMGTITHALAVSTDGRRRPIPPELVANSSSLQALITLQATVGRGPAALAALCAGIAERASLDARVAGSQDVVIETATYDAVAYFDGAVEPTAREEHVRCALPRAP